eukprot:gb/GEZN01006261.1/.p1 GENE.gb/GEZN01006261.1/~~gb/GEZN01006261.1/.p1  ORF type:complete len:447 (+),score=94.46 gb/GEZN01006261.1/:80-1420(+)
MPKKSRGKNAPKRVTKTKTASKGGAGGKGTWGAVGSENKYMHDGAALNQDDPNYEPLEDPVDGLVPGYMLYVSSEATNQAFSLGIMELTAFKKNVTISIDEYLASFDIPEFIRRIKELRSSLLHQTIPYLLIKKALDRNAEERLKISALLAALDKNAVVTMTQMHAGFAKAYNNLPDLMMDVPNAKTILGEFVSHAVDNAYMDRAKCDAMAAEVDQMKDQDLIAKAKTQYTSIVTEYFVSFDIEETVRATKELNTPFLNYELVKKIVSQGLDKKNHEREAASKVLAAIAHDAVSEEQMCKGFTLLLHRVEDLVLDVPDTLRLLAAFLARAVSDEALPPAFLARVDLSEGDMGAQVVARAQGMLQGVGAARRLENVWAEAKKRTASEDLRSPPIMDDGKWQEKHFTEADKEVHTLRVRVAALEKALKTQTDKTSALEVRLQALEAAA